MGAGLPRWLTGLLVVIVAGIGAFSLPAFTGSVPEPADEPDIVALAMRALEHRRNDERSGRPAYLPEPAGALSTASPPSPMSNQVLVSKTARWRELTLPYLLADTALPFRYHVERGLVERFGLETVVEAMSQWDGISGSRWRTELGSVVHHTGQGPRRDGHSVVHLRHDCPAGYLGTTRWNTDPERMHLDQRYGAAALYGTQVDIAVCAEVASADQLRGLLAHEVGHVMGMGHLCEPGEVCWTGDPGEDEAQRCRPMFALWGPCRDGLTERDHEAARHLYPTLPRLHGPSRVETAARASYALTWTHTADLVVLARADRGVPAALLGAALAGALDSPLLLGAPDPVRCVTGAAATELARASADHATVVLAGDWPPICERALAEWNLGTQRLELGPFLADDPWDSPDARLSVTAARALVERAEQAPAAAFLVTLGADEDQPAFLDAAIAAAESGRRGAALLFSQAGRLSPSVDRWLRQNASVREVWLVGPTTPDLLVDLSRRGVTIVRVSGADPLERAAFLAASHAPPPSREPQPVVIAPSDSLADAVVAAAVAGRLGAPLLLTPPEPDPVVLTWLERHPAHGGYVVGAVSALPLRTQRTYSTLVAGSRDPLPSLRTAPRGLHDLPGLLP